MIIVVTIPLVVVVMVVMVVMVTVGRREVGELIELDDPDRRCHRWPPWLS